MRYADFYECDICNGTHVGMSLFVQGCDFHCKGCFNPETWDYNGGKEWTEKTRTKFLKMAGRPYIMRISFLGGSPLCDNNVGEVLSLIKDIRAYYPDKKIWVYTGYSFEDILPGTETAGDKAKSDRAEILKYIDVLVDGGFVSAERDLTLAFCGSRNQRLIDIPKTLSEGTVCLYKTI